MFKCFQSGLSVAHFYKQIDRFLSPSSYLLAKQCQIHDFQVKNEPVLQYLQGSKERDQLIIELNELSSKVTHVPIVINGKEIFDGKERVRCAPFDHGLQLAKYYWAEKELIRKSIEESQKIRKAWEAVSFDDKIKIFLKAGDLVSGKYRQKLNAATMLGQGKTVIQAEIDSAAELADFFRLNAYFAKELHKYQPISPGPDIKNSLRFRGIEGFIASISPFNFTAIGGNLASSPCLMGNVVLWKPSEASILSNWIVFQVLKEAGIPDGVINFIPSKGTVLGDTITSSPDLAGVNFTGSVPTFRKLWQLIGNNLEIYSNFPRLVGECGGKNYHFIHESADIQSAVAQTIRAAFEYSGQKCSACSRLYVPDSIWSKFKQELLSVHSQLKLSSPLEFDTFLTAVIDDPAFERISNYISQTQGSNELQLLAGGKCDKSKGYYIEPTIIQTSNPNHVFMNEEIFGPVLTVFVYQSKHLNQALQLANNHEFGLTGAIFAQDKDFINEATESLKMSAGNFYINDKSTGAVVNQQPFGGGRLSGTNDKAGGPHYLLRWTSPQTIKQTFAKLTEWKYPYMQSN